MKLLCKNFCNYANVQGGYGGDDQQYSLSDGRVISEINPHPPVKTVSDEIE